MALRFSSSPRQLRVITGHGPFAHAYRSRPDVYPNYIKLGVMGHLPRLYSVCLSIIFDRLIDRTLTQITSNCRSQPTCLTHNDATIKLVPIPITCNHRSLSVRPCMPKSTGRLPKLHLIRRLRARLFYLQYSVCGKKRLLSFQTNKLLFWSTKNAPTL